MSSVNKSMPSFLAKYFMGLPESVRALYGAKSGAAVPGRYPLRKAAWNRRYGSDSRRSAYFLWIASRIGIFCMPMTLGQA